MGINETPYEIQERLKAQRQREAGEREDRAFAERARLERESTYVPPKDLGETNPVERQNYLAQRKTEDDAKAAEQSESLMKDRLRRAFLSAGGKESEFEEQYPGLRKRYINGQTMNILQGEVSEGSANADGTVRW